MKYFKKELWQEMNMGDITSQVHHRTKFSLIQINHSDLHLLKICGCAPCIAKHAYITIFI